MSAGVVLGESNFTVAEPTSRPVTQSSLNSPEGLTFDPSGNLWIADQGEHRILEFKAPFSNGESASLVIGQADFISGNSGVLPQANTLNGPKGVTFDKSGNLWVSDTQANRVIEYLPPFSNDQNASVAIGAANLTSFAYANDTSFGLNTPMGLAFDSSGSLWVADTQNDRVLQFQNVAGSTTAAASSQSTSTAQSSTLSSSTSQVKVTTTAVPSGSTSTSAGVVTPGTSSSSGSSATSISPSSLVSMGIAVLVIIAIAGVGYFKARKEHFSR
jgi:secreted PhoX family phosphatase